MTHECRVRKIPVFYSIVGTKYQDLRDWSEGLKISALGAAIVTSQPGKDEYELPEELSAGGYIPSSLCINTKIYRKSRNSFDRRNGGDNGFSRGCFQNWRGLGKGDKSALAPCWNLNESRVDLFTEDEKIVWWSLTAHHSPRGEFTDWRSFLPTSALCSPAYVFKRASSLAIRLETPESFLTDIYLIYSRWRILASAMPRPGEITIVSLPEGGNPGGSRAPRSWPGRARCPMVFLPGSRRLMRAEKTLENSDSKILKRILIPCWRVRAGGGIWRRMI